MTEALLIAAVLVAALSCPAMMWWQSRRGGAAAVCCAPTGKREQGSDLESLRRRQDELSGMVAESEGQEAEAAAAGRRAPRSPARRR